MRPTIAIIDPCPKFDAVFDPVAGEMRKDTGRYAALPMARPPL